MAAVYRGITVSKIIQLIDPASGHVLPSGIQFIKMGQQGQQKNIYTKSLVKVTIEVTLPDYHSRISIVDPLPGCLEALDDSFYTIPLLDDFGTDKKWWWYYHLYVVPETRSNM